MSDNKSWISKQRGNPIFLLIGAVGAVTGFYLSYNKIWKPFWQRRKLAQSEKFANYIIAQEQKQKNR